VGGAAAILLGAAAWGTTGTAAHFAPAGASPVSVGAARIVLGGAILLGMAVGQRGPRGELRALLRSSAAVRASLALAIASVSGFQLCFFSAVRLTGVAVGTVVTLGLAEPLVAALLGLVVLGERLTAATAAGLVLIGLALVALAVPGRSRVRPPGAPGTPAPGTPVAPQARPAGPAAGAG
jgi:drug/metabolite transporter, DME family